MGVLITRPAHQAQRTVDALRAAGAHVHELPLLDILPLSTPDLDATLGNYPRAALAIFVSANAATFGLTALAARHITPTGPQIAAIGAATASTLASAGMPVSITPDGQQDSETLLTHPALQALQGKTVMLFRGESEGGGRRLIAETLRERGATVLEALCYRRSAATPAPTAVSAVADALASHALHAVQVMSVESMEALVALASLAERIKRVTLLVPHARIAREAAAAGFGDVIVTDFGDDAFIDTLARLSARLSQ